METPAGIVGIRKVLVFCIAALGHDRDEFDAIVDSVFDPHDEVSVAAIARTQMMMECISLESERASRSNNPELTMLSRGIYRLINLQFPQGNCESRRQLLQMISKASPLASATVIPPPQYWH